MIEAKESTEAGRLRVLFVSDTHLGFDLPSSPRVERRRRGEDFFASFDRALEPARRGEVDLVVHGGDLLFRSKVKPSLVWRALEPLLTVAEGGTEVVLVLGNHERSELPFPLLAAHPRLHLIEEPRTLSFEIRGHRLALAAMPNLRGEARRLFPDSLEATCWHQQAADIRLLAIHDAVEGATVGPAEFVFRRRPDTIRAGDLPSAFAAVLAGHIHRHQVLREDLSGRPLPAPVFYPGSTERTSSAEIGEAKGYLLFELAANDHGGEVFDWSFVDLEVRTMAVCTLSSETTAAEQRQAILARIAELPKDTALIVRFNGRRPPALGAVELRALAPSTMTVESRWRR